MHLRRTDTSKPSVCMKLQKQSSSRSHLFPSGPLNRQRLRDVSPVTNSPRSRPDALTTAECFCQGAADMINDNEVRLAAIPLCRSRTLTGTYRPATSTKPTMVSLPGRDLRVACFLFNPTLTARCRSEQAAQAATRPEQYWWSAWGGVKQVAGSPTWTSIVTCSEPKLPTLIWPITMTTVNLLFMNPHGGTRLASLRRDLLAYLGTVRERSSNMVQTGPVQTLHQCNPESWIRQWLRPARSETRSSSTWEDSTCPLRDAHPLSFLHVTQGEGMHNERDTPWSMSALCPFSAAPSVS